MHSQTMLSRKERERLSRQEEILDAARQVFSERGFAKAKLDEIAEVAELGKGTIYNYFRSKEELFVRVIVRGIRRFQNYIEESIRCEPTPRDKIERFIDANLEFFEKNRQIFSILEVERNLLARSLSDEMFNQLCQLESEFLHYLAKLFSAGIRAGQFKKMNTTKMAQALFGLIHITMIHAIREPEKTNLRQDAKFLKQLFFNGIHA